MYRHSVLADILIIQYSYSTASCRDTQSLYCRINIQTTLVMHQRLIQLLEISLSALKYWYWFSLANVSEIIKGDGIIILVIKKRYNDIYKLLLPRYINIVIYIS